MTCPLWGCGFESRALRFVGLVVSQNVNLIQMHRAHRGFVVIELHTDVAEDLSCKTADQYAGHNESA